MTLEKLLCRNTITILSHSLISPIAPTTLSNKSKIGKMRRKEKDERKDSKAAPFYFSTFATFTKRNNRCALMVVWVITSCSEIP